MYISEPTPSFYGKSNQIATIELAYKLILSTRHNPHINLGQIFPFLIFHPSEHPNF